MSASEPALEAMRPRVVVGISGASGAEIGIRLLDELRLLGAETHLVVSRAGGMTVRQETDMSLQALRGHAAFSYAPSEIGARIASGSFRTDGMVIAPCSVSTLAKVAQGIDSTLLTRAAHVTLKERRRLVLLLRESPLTLADIRNMEVATLMGAVVALPVPSFYLRPASLGQAIDDIVARTIEHLGLPAPGLRQWQGLDRSHSQQRTER
ncbi:UbiX family flavin prenyltransferase [Schaalia naturae]|jgi:4-hydroxy-3-polyprenylbenzoate decarboxylase|uniref:Flavin prenyltransferase UbiX n=2 Tax=Schaalia naturae TaxID=635203 RepID=A0ABW2SIK6_9ACTO